MGARVRHAHSSSVRREGCHAHHNLGNRYGEAGVSVARGGWARTCRAQPTRQARVVAPHGGESAALRHRDGGVRECAALGAGVRTAWAYGQADAPEVRQALRCKLPPI